MSLIREAAQFLKQARASLRRDEATREPLTILRLEWSGGVVTCDWLMRSVNFTRERLPEAEAQALLSEQSFQDALALRDLIFEEFPAVMQARLKMYRADPQHQLELIMLGNVQRLESPLPKGLTTAQRAQKAGLQFELVNGVLGKPLPE